MLSVVLRMVCACSVHHQIAISDVSVADKEYGIQVGSSVSTWNGLAPQHVTISNVSISNCIDGLRIVTDSIDGDDPQGYWDFTNTSISNVDIVNCTNWSVIIDSNNNNTSKLKGIHLRDITAVAGSGGGGAGGMFFPIIGEFFTGKYQLSFRSCGRHNHSRRYDATFRNS